MLFFGLPRSESRTGTLEMEIKRLCVFQGKAEYRRLGNVVYVDKYCARCTLGLFTAC